MEQKRLTAQEANKIARKNDPNEALQSILTKIENVANNGGYELKVRDHGFSDSLFYSAKEKEYPTKSKQIIQELHRLGYHAEIKVEENQVADIYLLINWKNTL